MPIFFYLILQKWWHQVRNDKKLAQRLWLSIVAATVALLLLYVGRAYANAIFLDGIQLLPTVDDFFSGRLDLTKLFTPYGEHRIVIYRLIMIANSALFSLNMYLDPILSALASILTILLVTIAIRRTLAKFLSPVAISLLLIPVAAVGASLAYPPVVFMSLQFHLSTIVMLAIALLATASENTPATRITPILLCPLYFTFFSGGYFPGLLLAMGVALLAYVVIERKVSPARHIVLAVTAFFCAFVYAFTIVYRSNVFTTPLTQKVANFFSDFSQTICFFLGGFAAAFVDEHSYYDRISSGLRDVVFLSLGSIVFVFFGIALWLFVRRRMYVRTYLPIWLLFYPIGVIAAIRIGRNIGGWQWIMNDWYSFHLKFIPIALFWIFLFSALEALNSRRNIDSKSSDSSRLDVRWFVCIETVVFLLFSLLLSSTWLYTNRNQWQRGPFVKEWYASRRNAMLDAQVKPYDLHEILLVSEQEATLGMKILSKYYLNIFSTATKDSILQPAPVIGCDLTSKNEKDGWYEDGWIKKEASISVRTGPTGSIKIAAYIPINIYHAVYHDALTIDLLVGEAIIGTITITRDNLGDGNIQIVGNSKSTTVINLTIRASTSFVPAKIPGQSLDERDIALIITDITCE
jgi:hypothetical protein